MAISFKLIRRLRVIALPVGTTDAPPRILGIVTRFTGGGGEVAGQPVHFSRNLTLKPKRRRRMLDQLRANPARTRT